MLVAVWVPLLAVVVYASAAATGTLYPTGRRPGGTRREAINASPAVVALYGPILDVHSLGELAMTKMTVLYAVFVALHVPGRSSAGTPAARRSPAAPSCSAARRSAATPRSRPRSLEGALVAVVARRAGRASPTSPAGCRSPGRVAFGASWAGVGLVAVGLTAVACQLSASARTCAAHRRRGASASSTLLRAVGDTGADVAVAG